MVLRMSGSGSHCHGNLCSLKLRLDGNFFLGKVKFFWVRYLDGNFCNMIFNLIEFHVSAPIFIHQNKHNFKETNNPKS